MRINRTRRSQGLPHLAQLVEHLTVVGKNNVSADIRVSPVQVKKLGELVDHPKGVIPSDFDVSKQIVHILSLLQPLKLWEGGQESEALTSTDYPLKIVTPDYKPGTAGYFAQHPFGAVMEKKMEMKN